MAPRTRHVRGRAPAPEGVEAARRARSRKREEVAVLAAAEDVFASEGYDAASLAVIAKDARLSPRKIQKLFQSKERLFAAVLLAHAEAVAEAIEQAALHEETCRGRLESIVRLRAGAAERRRAFTRILDAGPLETTFAPAAAPEAVRAWGRVRSRIRAVIADGIRSGELRRELDPDLLAAMLDAAIRAYIERERKPDGQATEAEEADRQEAEIRAVVSMLLDGLAAPPPEEPPSRRGRRRS